MTTKTTEILKTQLIEIISTLSFSEQEQVLKYATSLHKKQLFQDWDSISDEEAEAIKNEFALSDLALSEAVLKNYLPNLEKEDIL
ncbi:hypothetical protein [Argonema antarcticum]|uniref:hypothetical protein n=1 Tax=Argonema antarcticum TaxID=2942763 RepID=UPI002010FC94|nr:hypothetical protein [Argonema antarcticum]MCL1475298.1 hypothetical protein [Argonema antarcticum A004/B2]